MRFPDSQRRPGRPAPCEARGFGRCGIFFTKKCASAKGSLRREKWGAPKFFLARTPLLWVNAKPAAGVAQLAEQLICNQQVAGSSPIASSSFAEKAGRRRTLMIFPIFFAFRFGGWRMSAREGRHAGEAAAFPAGTKGVCAFCRAWWGSRAAKGNRL